jgi:hypothetical protein
MVLWANLHPSFTFGLALLYVVAGYSCFEKILRRDYAQCKNELFAVITVSVCALLTPYGVYSALITLDTMHTKHLFSNIAEWRPPNFQQNHFRLFMVGFFMAVTGLGVRLGGPRLIVYGMVLTLGLSYERGFTIFCLLTPIIFARPVSECASGLLAAEGKHVPSSQATDLWRAALAIVLFVSFIALGWRTGIVVAASVPLVLAIVFIVMDAMGLDLHRTGSSNPVLLYLQKRSIMIPTIFLAAATLATAASWRQLNVSPPESVAPRAALEFVKKTGIMGNVFNNYDFGGYLIFEGIQTFIDGRVLPYTDKFFQEYFDTVGFTDSKSAFQLLDRYKVQWVLLGPTDPLAKALAKSDQWRDVYSDEYSTVLVRSR